MSHDPDGNGGEAATVVDLSAGLLDVRDQGRRGTCLAVAATAVHEHARLRRRGETSPELSIELLFWRCKQLDGAPAEDGTDFAAARDALSDPGQPLETSWPYDDARDHTAAAYSPPADALQAHGLRRATLRPVAADAGAIRQALRTGHVVVVGLELWDAFYYCDTATLASPSGDLDGAGHAVCLVGFDDDQRTVRVRNSWGTRWGDRGYAWLATDALRDVLWEAWVADDDLDGD